MPEKDEFTFEDDDHLPETDLSDVFADAEREAPEPMDAAGTAEDFPEAEEVLEDPPPPQESPGGGGSKNRTLLLILLLVVVAAGAYFLLAPEGMAPESPAPQPADKQIVAVPPPAKVPLPVETPPSHSAATDNSGGEEKAAMAEQTAVKPENEEAAAAPAATPEQTEGETAEAKPDKHEQAKDETSSQPQIARQAPAPAAGNAGTYVLDAGAFLFASQSDDLINKISELGYKPVVTEVKASVRLIRLRVGSYPKEQGASALDDIRKIAPGAFSLVRDGQSVVYAGSFADQLNIKKLTDRLREKGIDVVEEPVKVDRNLSRIQFGEFSDEASAETAAGKVEAAGIPVRVVKK